MQSNKNHIYFPPEAEVRGSNPLGAPIPISPPQYHSLIIDVGNSLAEKQQNYILPIQL